MFTIKIFGAGGHSVIECSQYRFVLGDRDTDGLLTTIDRLLLPSSGDDGQGPVISVGLDTIYVMNSNGKTVDTYHPYSPDDPRRWAVAPDSARRMADLGNDLAREYVQRIGPSGEMPSTPV